MQVINAGTNEDGTPHYHYYAPGEHVVITPNEVTGPVTLADGTTYDLTPRVVAVKDETHAAEIAAHIEKAV